MRDDETVLQFINRIRLLASDLKNMDVLVEENYIAMALLCGLPGRFENLIVTIDTMIQDRELSLHFVKCRLLQREQKINDHVKEEPSIDAALIGQPSRKKISNQSFAIVVG